MWLQKKTKCPFYIFPTLNNILIEASEKVGAVHRVSLKFHGGVVSVPLSDILVKASYANTKELSSPLTGHYVTPLDFCFVNKWQRG